MAAHPVQALDSHATGPALPFPTQLFGLRPGGDCALRGAAWQRAGRMAATSLPTPVYRRSRPRARSFHLRALPRAWRPKSMTDAWLIRNAELINENKRLHADA